QLMAGNTSSCTVSRADSYSSKACATHRQSSSNGAKKHAGPDVAHKKCRPSRLLHALMWLTFTTGRGESVTGWAAFSQRKSCSNAARQRCAALDGPAPHSQGPCSRMESDYL